MRSSAPVQFIFACSLLSAPVFADGPPAAPAASTERAGDSPVPTPLSQERIQVNPTRAVLVRDGNVLPLQKEITLTDGTKVKPDGGILRPNGTALKLGAGEWLDLNGVVCDPAHPSVAVVKPTPSGVVSASGTDSINQAGLDLGTAEAKRRTEAAVDEAVTAAPNNSAK